MDFPQAESDRLRTMLRLMVGAAVIDWDELLAHLERWEQDVSAASAAKSAGPSCTGTIVFVEPGTREVPPMFQAQELRYMLLGMRFETESHLRRRSWTSYKAAGWTANIFFKPFTERHGRDCRHPANPAARLRLIPSNP